MGNHLYFVKRSSMKITILLVCLIVVLAAVNPALCGKRSPARGPPGVGGPIDGIREKRSPQSPPGRPKPRGKPNRPPRGGPKPPRGGQKPPRGGPNDGGRGKRSPQNNKTTEWNMGN